MWWSRPTAAQEVASFDSATGMLRALSHYLHGTDLPLLGALPPALEPVMSGVLGAANRLPQRMAERLYAASGWAEAVPPEHTGEISSDALAAWITDHYPRRRFPMAFIGSSNGALVHLAAALGVPWLPQTVLIPVRRRGGRPDQPDAALEAHRSAGEALLAANPDITLHHMHDPNQDRLMVAGMSYFRIKWHRLPPAYHEFLQDRLEPDGVVVTSECGTRWPTTQVADRYVFQHGAVGGLRWEDYRDRWGGPEPDGDSPEAEWGFDDMLLRDLPEKHIRLRYDEPEDLSAAVADLYRDWYERRGLPTSRLLAECFVVLDPWQALRTGMVPYWMVFNTEPSRQALLSYLEGTTTYDEIRLMLFSHGVESEGLADIEAWREVLDRARRHGAFTGVDTRAYPRDFASLARAHRDLSRVPYRHPMPAPMTPADVGAFLDRHGAIEWKTH